jgi:hypothetical protein
MVIVIEDEMFDGCCCRKGDGVEISRPVKTTRRKQQNNPVPSQ